MSDLFPSSEHYRTLREICREHVFFPAEAERFWLAYDLGWRRATGKTEHSPIFTNADKGEILRSPGFASLVDAAAEFYRQQQPLRWENYELQREGRDILNKWARRNGFENWDAAYEAGRTYAEVVREFGDMKRMPIRGSDVERSDPYYPAGSLGVTATETSE
jgi:hypothetical protein